VLTSYQPFISFQTFPKLISCISTGLKAFMIDYPDFLNVRKLALIFVVGPLALLALFVVLDLSIHSSKVLKVSEQSCARLEKHDGIQNVDCP
jgi:hypothetical protein